MFKQYSYETTPYVIIHTEDAHDKEFFDVSFYGDNEEIYNTSSAVQDLMCVDIEQVSYAFCEAKGIEPNGKNCIDVENQFKAFLDRIEENNVISLGNGDVVSLTRLLPEREGYYLVSFSVDESWMYGYEMISTYVNTHAVVLFYYCNGIDVEEALGLNYNQKYEIG